MAVSSKHHAGSHQASLLAAMISVMVAAIGSMALGFQISVANGCLDAMLVTLGIPSPALIPKGLVRREFQGQASEGEELIPPAGVLMSR